MIIRFALLTCFLVPAFFSAFGQSEKESFLRVGVDAYGVYLPLYFYDVYTHKHLHAALNIHGLGNVGPTFSYWGFSYPIRNYRGIGLQHSRQWRNFTAKLEGGMLLHYEMKHKNYIIGLNQGRNIPYFRLHLGYKFGRFIATGLVLNWIPPSKHIVFVANFSGAPVDPRGFTSWKNSPDHHESLVVFVGFSIR